MSLTLLGAGPSGVGGAAGSYPLTGLSATAGWSRSRNLLSSFSSAKDTVSAGTVTTLFDQTGNSRNLTSSGTNAPADVTAGPNSLAACGFDGVNDYMLSGTNLSTFISASAGYVIATIYIDSFPKNQALSYQNSAVFIDGGQFAGLLVRSGNILYAFNWDGNEDKAQGTTNASTAYVVEWRHDTGNIYQRVNGAGETSVASGNTTTITSSIGIGGHSSGGGTNQFAGKIFEMATFSAVPTQVQRDALVQDFGHWVGASV